MADATFTALKKAWFENLGKCVEIYWFFYHKKNKEALIMLCSVVKHLGSG